MTEIVLPTLHCLRCGHTWPPRKPERPLRCAKCGSPYWDRTRRESSENRPVTSENHPVKGGE